MIHSSIAQVVGDTPVVRLDRLFAGTGATVLAKLDYLNPIGSTKDRVARHVIEQSISRGLIAPGGHIVESSSGNFAIALSALGPLYGLRVTCVVDPVITDANLTILRHLGATVVMVDDKDEHGGYLGSRLREVREIVDTDPRAMWINQYANELCWQAHVEGTAAEMADQIDVDVDLLVVAVSTTATLHGTARGLRRRWPALRTAAVDAEGSVIFGGQGHARRLPGLGSSQPSRLMTADQVDDIVRVCDADAVRGCRDLLRTEGILAGASSGALVAGIRAILDRSEDGLTVATILPDRGERYLGHLYGTSAE